MPTGNTRQVLERKRIENCQTRSHLTDNLDVSTVRDGNETTSNSNLVRSVAASVVEADLSQLFVVQDSSCFPKDALSSKDSRVHDASEHIRNDSPLKAFEVVQSRQCGCRQLFEPRRWVLVMLAASHFIFIALLCVMVHYRWWEGDVLTQCGHDGRPYVGEKCVCGGTLPSLCWISEALNGTWGAVDGQEEQIVVRSRIWLILSFAPALSGVALLVFRKRRLDVAAGLLSCIYLLISLLPDTLPSPWLSLHYIVAFIGIIGGLVLQFALPWQITLLTITSYGILYVGISECMVKDGADRKNVYDFSFKPGSGTGPGSFVEVVAEWVMVFGSAFIAICYCVVEASGFSEDGKNWSVLSALYQKWCNCLNAFKLYLMAPTSKELALDHSEAAMPP